MAQGQTPADLEPRSIDQERRALEQRLEQERRTASPDIHLPRPAPEAARRLPIDETPCFTIHQLELAGDESVQFEWLLEYADGQGRIEPPDPVMGRCLGAQGIQMVVDRLQSALIAQGFVTSRVVTPPQNLKTGTLVLHLLPGRLESIEWADGVVPWASRWNTVPIGASEVLNLRDVEQALENYKRVPSADVQIQITPGTEPGTSRLLIDHRQARPLRLSMSVDDGAGERVGRLQGNLTLSVDNPLAMSDLFYVTQVSSLAGTDKGKGGSHGQHWHYSVPLGYGMVTLGHSHQRFHQQVVGASQDYRYSGTQRHSEFKIARVLHRDALSKTAASLKGFVRSSSNYIDDTEIEVQRRVVAGMEWGLNHRRSWRDGLLDVNLQFRRGIDGWGSLPAPEEATGEGTSRMKVWMWDGSLQQSFKVGGQKLHYAAHARAQIHRTPLTPQDRFSIGGRHSVRGFDGETVLVGESGWLLRNELALHPMPGHQAYVGVDTGKVRGPTTSQLTGTRLTGVVLGLRGQWARVNYELFVGQPLHMPRRFSTAGTTAGFSVGASL